MCACGGLRVRKFTDLGLRILERVRVQRLIRVLRRLGIKERKLFLEANRLLEYSGQWLCLEIFWTMAMFVTKNQ